MFAAACCSDVLLDALVRVIPSTAMERDLHFLNEHDYF
jgi:hypothetical protein